MKEKWGGRERGVEIVAWTRGGGAVERFGNAGLQKGTLRWLLAPGQRHRSSTRTECPWSDDLKNVGGQASGSARDARPAQVHRGCTQS